VSSGDLTTTERIDGSLLLSNSIQVLHRIDGQTSSATSSGSTTPTRNATSNRSGQGAAAPAAPAATTATTTPSQTVTTRTTQTVTSIARVGSPIALGDLIYKIDNQPVIALLGPLPAWRTLSVASTDGPDIVQLEYSLVALGYDPDGKVKVDNHFDTTTATMVKAWQTGLGETPTGSVPLGSVVFLPTPTTALDVSAKVGDKVVDGTKILTLATDAQQIVIDVPTADQSRIVPGLVVAVGGGQGTVELLRSITRSNAVVVQAVITPNTPIQNASNGATVSVTVSLDALKGVLIVPAQALVSRLDGTYAVQVQAADGSTTWHTVELLGVSGSKVGIRGDGVSAGTVVLVPV
jgi:peptidoglycan hydrolase-like protein with peptidoglycan-binding domain